jgi:lipopolysaccharide export system permease protein
MRLFTIPLLQRYILYELLKVFTFLLSILTILLVFVGVFREATMSGLGPIQALRILPYVVPNLLPFTIPATLLLTVSVVYGRMSGDQEITAAKAAGINVLSLLWPSFLLGAVLSVCSLILVDQAIPWANAKIQKTVTMLMEDIFLDRLRSQREVSDYDRGFSITVWGVEGKKLIYPTFHYTPPGRRAVTILAQEATLKFDLKEEQVVLSLVRASIIAPGNKRVFVEQKEYPIPFPQEVKRAKPRHLSIRDIRRDLSELINLLEETRLHRDLEAALALGHGDFDRLLKADMGEYDEMSLWLGIDRAKLHTEIHSRFALSSSCFFFALVGAPFAIMQARRQFLTSFFFCFGPILLLYYPVVLLAMNLSKSGSVHPVLMWVGNLLMLVVGWYLLRRVLKY